MIGKGFESLVIALSIILIIYTIYPLLNVIAVIDFHLFTVSLARDEVRRALFVSLSTATTSMFLVAAFGVPLGFAIARYRIPCKFLLRVAIIIPLVIPPLASGGLLLGVFGPYATLGQFIQTDLTQSILGIIIAQTYVSSPFMVLSAQSAFESVDESYEHIARILGKSRLETFILVTLPLSKNGLIVGFILTWVRALGELGATMMMSYNPHTISIQIFEDNAIGGLQHAAPSILAVVIISITILIAANAIGRKESIKLM